jgi:PD-(D/E)XK nuclease superfamily
MSEEFIPTLTHATERDIDLILVEELFSSTSFVEWAALKTGLSQDIKNSTVLHSKRRTRNRREIDIFIEITHGNGKRSALLIENKLDADEQPDQAESYREELARICGNYTNALMVIVCPEAYANVHDVFVSKFDTLITYEALTAYFQKRIGASDLETSQRMTYRRDVLLQAIHKHRRGYTPIPNKVVGDFNALYVALLAEIAPEILPGKNMLKPANPDESTSMIFNHKASFADFSKAIRPTRFSHELGRGKDHRANYVSVVFGGWGAALSEIRDKLVQDATSIGASFSAKAPNKSRPNPGLVMSCATTPVDNQGDFSEQKDNLTTGIQEAAKLREWLLENRDLIGNWRMMVDQYKNTASPEVKLRTKGARV